MCKSHIPSFELNSYSTFFLIRFGCLVNKRNDKRKHASATLLTNYKYTEGNSGTSM